MASRQDSRVFPTLVTDLAELLLQTDALKKLKNGQKGFCECSSV